jgi:hypothetical protein
MARPARGHPGRRQAPRAAQPRRRGRDRRHGNRRDGLSCEPHERVAVRRHPTTTRTASSTCRSSPSATSASQKIPGNANELARLAAAADAQIVPANAEAAPAATPLRAGGPIKHVFYIVRENRTFDQVLGDDPRGDGDPSLTLFGRQRTPNVHALVSRFSLVAELRGPRAPGRLLHLRGVVPATGLPLRPGRPRRRVVVQLRRGGRPRAALPRQGPRRGRRRRRAPPLLAVGPRPGRRRVLRQRRRDRKRSLARRRRGLRLLDARGRAPRLAVAGGLLPREVRRPGRLSDGAGLQLPRPDERPHARPPAGRAAHRTVAAVISPYAKYGAVIHTRYDQLSIDRSIELILRLRPLGLQDALATPMYDAFTSTPMNADAR